MDTEYGDEKKNANLNKVFFFDLMNMDTDYSDSWIHCIYSSLDTKTLFFSLKLYQKSICKMRRYELSSQISYSFVNILLVSQDIFQPYDW